MPLQPTLFDNHSIPISPPRSKLTTTSRDGETVVFWNRHFAVTSYRNADDVSKRAAAVFLVQAKLGGYAEIASLMGWSESNLYVIMRQYRDKGMLGLFKQKTGPRNVKVTPEIQQYILKTKRRTHNTIIKHIQKHYGVSLTQPMIHYVKYGKVHHEQLNLFSDALLQSLIVDEESVVDASALPMEVEEVSDEDWFPADSKIPTPSTGSRPCSPNDPPSDNMQTAHQTQEALIESLASSAEAMNEETTIKETYPSAEAPDDPRKMPALPETTESQGNVGIVESRYAGGFLLLPFLQQIDPAGLFEQAQKASGKVSEWGTQAYGLSRFMSTLVFLLWFRFSSIEDFKFVQPREFGVLLGKKNAPSVKTLRRYFPSVLNGEVIEQWMLQLVRRYVQLDVIQLGTLYFDGHKIPYYGHTDLPKGYLSSRRFPAKLIEQVFANDRSGRPVFLRVHDTSISFKSAVLGMIEDAQGLWKERGIRAPLVVAFDRELYDTDLFATLDQMGVLYITWRKWDTPVAKERLTEEIRFASGQATSEEEDAIEYRAWRRMITVQGYATEAISFLSEEKVSKDPDRTPSTLVTNAARFTKSEYPDFDPLSTREIIETLCDRWRQENYFRHSKHEQRLDYNPSYGTKERQESLTTANPLIKELKQEVKQLRNEIDKLNDKIATRLTGRKKKDKPLEEVLQQKSVQKLTQQKEQSEQQIHAIREQLSTLPERIPVGQEDQPSLELELEGKRFLDVLRIAMHNAEQMLLDVFKRCYSDSRDVHKVLRAIADQGGTVEERRDVIMVELNPLHIPTHRRATEQLCRELNAMESRRVEDGKKILFKVKK